jgi:hypothetical protein
MRHAGGAGLGAHLCLSKQAKDPLLDRLHPALERPPGEGLIAHAMPELEHDVMNPWKSRSR